MDIRNHPDDSLMLALSSGHLAVGARLVLLTHLELCAHCRSRLRELDRLGGMWLEDEEPAPLSANALDRNLALIAEAERLDRSRSKVPISVSAPPTLPEGVSWPRALLPCSTTPWRWGGLGIRWSRVTVPEAPDESVMVFRVAAGRRLPSHRHSGVELTQVLHGRFHDGRALFGRGDLAVADADVQHEPVVQEGSECICVISHEGRLRFDNALARVFGAMTGM